MMITATIFDVDGTLVDSVSLHAKAWQETFQHYGFQVELEAVRKQIGKGGDHLMPVFLTKEQVEEKGEEIEAYRRKLFKDKYLGSVKPLPGVRTLFQRLQADKREIALASSSKGDELKVYKRIAQIEDLLDAETSSDDAETSKPDPDIFLAALERLDEKRRDRIVVIGDSPYDAEAATKAGLQTVGLLSGGFGREDLSAAGCVEIFQDASDLLTNYERSVLRT